MIVGDRVKIISKSMGRKFSAISYREGIISSIYPITNGYKYTINHDWFIGRDLVILNKIKIFSDKDFEL